MFYFKGPSLNITYFILTNHPILKAPGGAVIYWKMKVFLQHINMSARCDENYLPLSNLRVNCVCGGGGKKLNLLHIIANEDAGDTG